MTDGIRTQVRLHLESVQPEGLAYMECPECGGADKLMLVPLDDGTTYFKCLRASCTTWGNSGYKYRKMEDSLPEGGRRTYPKWQELQDVKTDAYTERSYFEERYGLAVLAATVLCSGTFVDDFGRLRCIFPVHDVSYRTVGYVARAVDDNPNYKALIRPYRSKGSLLAWYGHNNLRNSPLVIVEDQISAARIGTHLPCVALLGTTMNAADQLTVRGRNCYVVLDNDAVGAGVKLASELGCPYFPLMGPDVKDMKELVFQQFLSSIGDA